MPIWADRANQRLEGINRLYVGLMTSIVIFLVAFAKFEYEHKSALFCAVLLLISWLGTGVSLSWWLIVRFFREHNEAKRNVLHKLEEELPYAFYKCESELLKNQSGYLKILKITGEKIDTILPRIFLGLSICLFISTFLFWDCNNLASKLNREKLGQVPADSECVSLYQTIKHPKWALNPR